MRSIKHMLSQQWGEHICDLCSKFTKDLHTKEDEAGYIKHCCDHCFYEGEGKNYEVATQEPVVVQHTPNKPQVLKEVKLHQVIKDSGHGGGHGHH